jgi:hypothetical protein
VLVVIVATSISVSMAEIWDLELKYVHYQSTLAKRAPANKRFRRTDDFFHQQIARRQNLTLSNFQFSEKTVIVDLLILMYGVTTYPNVPQRLLYVVQYHHAKKLNKDFVQSNERM